MSKYERKAKRAKKEPVKAPRCCGMHMFMNKYGLWQCRKCGRQKFDTGNTKPVEQSVDVVEPEVVSVDNTSCENIVDVEPEVVSTVEA